MSKKEDILDHKEPENQKDGTNWSYWYIGLLGFLLLQIAIYSWITLSYK